MFGPKLFTLKLDYSGCSGRESIWIIDVETNGRENDIHVFESLEDAMKSLTMWVEALGGWGFIQFDQESISELRSMLISRDQQTEVLTKDQAKKIIQDAYEPIHESIEQIARRVRNGR